MVAITPKDILNIFSLSQIRMRYIYVCVHKCIYVTMFEKVYVSTESVVFRIN